MNVGYIISHRINGANPFKIYEAIKSQNQEELCVRLKALSYDSFLKTSYWFAISSVVKSNAKMRCQVCNGTESIQVHHRTYDSHGREHENMCDLVVLCKFCHGMFHGHMPMRPLNQSPHGLIQELETQHPKDSAITSVENEMPNEAMVVLTKRRIDQCRSNGSFTTAALNALGVSKSDRKIKGWISRLCGKIITRDQFRKCLLARYIYAGGKMK